MRLLTFVKAVPRTIASKAGAALGAAHRGLSFLWCLPVRIYRKFLSPLKGHGTCRFTPTCSRYFLDAVAEWGILIGTALALWRLIRCNPFSEGGYDPVPARRETLRRLRAVFRRSPPGIGRDAGRGENSETRETRIPEDGDNPQ